MALGLLNFAVKVPLYLQEKEISPHTEGWGREIVMKEVLWVCLQYPEMTAMKQSIGFCYSFLDMKAHLVQ